MARDENELPYECRWGHTFTCNEAKKESFVCPYDRTKIVAVTDPDEAKTKDQDRTTDD